MLTTDGKQPPHHIGLILLAAGGSTRLGRPKQLVEFRGRSLLRGSAEAAIASGAGPILVVLGADAERLRPELAGLLEDVTVVVNPEWEEGMSSSIRCGIAALDSTDVSAAALLVCDQPHVTGTTLRRLFESFQALNVRAAVSDYGDAVTDSPGAGDAVTGPPCVFDRSLFPELLALRGPQGAKPLIRRLPEADVLRVPFRDGRIDIDTPTDLAKLLPPGRVD